MEVPWGVLFGSRGTRNVPGNTRRVQSKIPFFKTPFPNTRMKDCVSNRVTNIFPTFLPSVTNPLRLPMVPVKISPVGRIFRISQCGCSGRKRQKCRTSLFSHEDSLGSEEVCSTKKRKIQKMLTNRQTRKSRVQVAIRVRPISSIRDTKAPKTLVLLCFGASRKGRMIHDRSLLTS